MTANASRPLIGISVNVSPPDDEQRQFSRGTSVHYLQEPYLAFVEAGEGVPVMLPALERTESVQEMSARLDGVIIAGGVDVDPAFYGETNTYSRGCNPVRDRFEIQLVREFVRRRRPVMGICRGLQVMNIALGGSLVQDIAVEVSPSLKHHRWEDGRESFHQVAVSRDTVLWEILQSDELEVNSSHHQAVKVPGEGLVVAAHAPDGVLEAVVSAENPNFLGVQWHPERMLDRPAQVALARWFVDRCRRRR